MNAQFFSDLWTCIRGLWWDWQHVVIFVVLILVTMIILSRLGKLKGQSENGSWKNLGQELHKRYSEPFKQPSLAIYFLVALVFGALGVWYAVIESIILNNANLQSVSMQSGIENVTEPDTLWLSESVFRALLTYFPALGVLSCVQLIIAEDDKKGLRSLFSFFLLLLLAAALIAAILFPHFPKFAVLICQIGVIVAIVTWWLVNGLAKDLIEAPNPKHILGPEPNRNIKGKSGGFKI